MTNDKKNTQEIDEYIAQFPKDVQEKLRKMRQTIREAAPTAQESISYGMPTYKLNGNLVHFAAHKRHIGFYPSPSGIEAFRLQLVAYDTSKGAIKFPLNQPIPYDVVRDIVIFRAGENMSSA